LLWPIAPHEVVRVWTVAVRVLYCDSVNCWFSAIPRRREKVVSRMSKGHT
jgi:hypothetical protein